MHRRSFIKTSTIATAGLMTIPGLACQRQAQFGLQIYSVRGAVNENLEKSLEQLAEMGYTYIEHAGYRNGTIYGLAPADFKSLIESFGMELISGHVGMNPEAPVETWKKAIADNAEAGLKYMVVPSIGGRYRSTVEAMKKTCDAFNKMGEICQHHAITFGYHNHAFEFETLGNTTMYDQLLQGTDPDLVSMELDLYWVIKGKVQPVDLFKRYPKRFKLWHVKDMEEGEEGFFAEVGSGKINFKEIFAHSKQAGLEYYFVEQDASRRDPMESVRMSAEYLKGQKWA